MLIHSARIVVISFLIIASLVYPYLPGEYDHLAIPLSTMAQVLGWLGLLLVPVGGLWLAYEFHIQARRRQNLPVTARNLYFGIVSLILGALVAVAVAVVAFATSGPSLALLTLAVWLVGLSRLIPKLRVLKNVEQTNFNPTPLYLVLLPLVACLSQFMLAAPITAMSRTQAMTMSAEFIHAIEAYRAANGRYPLSLQAVWKDYSPGVVGVEQFHYAPNATSYNLFFEQPRFLFEDFGVREFVVYNPQDEQMMISHASWILLLPPEELVTTQGWYAVHNAPVPYWKYFWFD